MDSARCTRGRSGGERAAQFESTARRPAKCWVGKTAETCSEVSWLRYNRGVNITLTVDLADSLNAAWMDRQNIHNDLCTVFTVSPEFGCTCRVPALLVELAALLGVDSVEMNERARALPEAHWAAAERRDASNAAEAQQVLIERVAG